MGLPSKSGFLLIGVVLFGSAASQADELHAVQPIPGLSCMSVKMTEQQAFDFNAMPPVMQEPSATSQRIGSAAAVVMTVEPPRIQNGYVAMMMLNGKYGWVQASRLEPYTSKSTPPAHCVPSMMSNGRPGLAFPR